MNTAAKELLFLANEPALDLLNTTPVLAEGPVDLLETFVDLTTWLAATGLMDEPKAKALARRWGSTREGEAAVARAKALREALREIITARLGGGKMPAKAVAILNDALGAARTSAQLEWNEKAGSFSPTQHHATDGKAEEALTIIAQAAARLLTQKDASLIRRCENPACVLHFYDTSKNHRRRWCSMDQCGNRMKAAAHYRRQKETGQR